MNKYGFVMLSESNAQELAKTAEEVGALAFRGQLQYPGPETGDWEIGADVIPLTQMEEVANSIPIEAGFQEWFTESEDLIEWLDSTYRYFVASEWPAKHTLVRPPANGGLI